MLGRYTTGPSDERGGYQTVPRYPPGPMPVIDLRSDTVTKPTPEMRRAMAEAEVGDDVFGDDPTVIALEERAAELLGKEAGLFVASGAMGNLVAQMAHLQRGQEVIAGAHGHIVLHEAASYAVVVGASVRPIEEQPDGTLDLDEVREAFRDPTDVHDPITGLVVFENASAHANNQPVGSGYVRDLAAVAHDGGVPLHIDGARFWNAVVALDEDPRELAGPADSVTFCLSKGLACPVGSVLVGSKDVHLEGAAGPEAPRRRDAAGRDPRGGGSGRAPGRRRGDDRSTGGRSRERPLPRRGPGGSSGRRLARRGRAAGRETGSTPGASGRTSSCSGSSATARPSSRRSSAAGC